MLQLSPVFTESLVREYIFTYAFVSLMASMGPDSQILSLNGH